MLAMPHCSNSLMPAARLNWFCFGLFESHQLEHQLTASRTFTGCPSGLPSRGD
jgi:hypothetical protein